MAKLLKKKKKNQGITLIKKSNKLIEARYKFDVWETRIFLSVLAQIRREDSEFTHYRIWYKDVIKIFELNSGQSYALLREAADRLMSKQFNVDSDDGGFDRVTKYHIIRKVNYLKAGQESKEGVESQEYIDITIEAEMKPLLLELQKNFTSYDLEHVIKLGTYPIRVYELLKQYEKIGWRKLYIDEMKRMFELTEEYPLFANFNQKIIKPSIKQINSFTDLTVTKVERIKRGRQIVALKFIFISKNNKEANSIVPTNDINAQSIVKPATLFVDANSMNHPNYATYEKDVVERFGVTPKVFAELLNSYSSEAVEKAIRVTNRAKYYQQIKTNVAGFFVQALRNDFTDAKEETEKKKSIELAIAQLRNALDEKIKLYYAAINDLIRTIVHENPDLTNLVISKIKSDAAYQALLLEKENALGKTLDIDDFRQDIDLRELVKTSIIHLHKKRFDPVILAHENEIDTIQAAISTLG